jgi:hypothetical protein
MPKEFEFALEERVEGRLAMMEQAAKRDHDEELAAQEVKSPRLKRKLMVLRA